LFVEYMLFEKQIKKKLTYKQEVIISNTNWSDKVQIKKLIKKNNHFFTYIDENLKQDLQFVLELIELKPKVIEYVKVPLRNNLEFLKKAFCINYKTIEYLSHEHYRLADQKEKNDCLLNAFKNYDIIKNKNPQILPKMKSCLFESYINAKSNKEIENIKKNAVVYVKSEEFVNLWKHNKEFALIVVSQIPRFLDNFADEIRYDLEVFEKAINTCDKLKSNNNQYKKFGIYRFRTEDIEFYNKTSSFAEILAKSKFMSSWLKYDTNSKPKYKLDWLDD